MYDNVSKYYDQLSKQYALHDEFEEIRNCNEWRIRNTARYELIQTSFYLTPIGRIEIMNKRNTQHRYKDFSSPVSPITPIHIINPGIKIPVEYVLDDTEPIEVINPGYILSQDINDLTGPKMFDPNRNVEDDEEYYSVLDQEIDHYVSSIYNMIDLVSILIDDLSHCITKTSNDEDQEENETNTDDDNDSDDHSSSEYEKESKSDDDQGKIELTVNPSASKLLQDKGVDERDEGKEKELKLEKQTSLNRNDSEAAIDAEFEKEFKEEKIEEEREEDKLKPQIEEEAKKGPRFYVLN